MRFAYADPPYPGRAKRYYQMPEVNHRLLIAHLEEIAPDGWALSTAADALREVLPLCPEGARVCAWVKPIGACPLTHGLHNTWEPLVVVRGRQVRPGKRDWLQAQPARGGGELPGRKPLAFCAWLWSCLGAAPGDALIDVFPGTGIVGRAWAELSAAPALATATHRPRPQATGVAEDLSDLSSGAAAADLSPGALSDLSSGAAGAAP